MTHFGCYIVSMRIFAFALILFSVTLVPISAYDSTWDAYRYGSHYLEREVVSGDGTFFSLVPDFSGKTAFLEEAAGRNPQINLELLFHMEQPALEDGTKNNLLLTMMKAAANLHALEGLQYYSRSWDRLHPLIEEAGLVDEVGSTELLADPVFNNLPRKSRYLYYQKDTRFGAVWYDLIYDSGEDYVSLTLENRTTMKYMLFPVFEPQSLVIRLYLIPRENEMLLYGTSYGTYPRILSFAVDFEDSFERRLSALQKWVADQLFQ